MSLRPKDGDGVVAEVGLFIREDHSDPCNLLNNPRLVWESDIKAVMVFSRLTFELISDCKYIKKYIATDNR